MTLIQQTLIQQINSTNSCLEIDCRTVSEASRRRLSRACKLLQMLILALTYSMLQALLFCYINVEISIRNILQALLLFYFNVEIHLQHFASSLVVLFQRRNKHLQHVASSLVVSFQRRNKHLQHVASSPAVLCQR